MLEFRFTTSFRILCLLSLFSLCMQVKESPDSGVYVKDLTTFVVRNADDMDKIMTKGNVNRKVC